MIRDSEPSGLSRRDFLRRVGIGVAGVGVTTAGTASWVSAADPQFVFRYSGPLATNDPSSQAMQIFKQRTEKGSDGRIRIEVFDGGKLGSVVEVLEQVRSGAVGLSHASASFLQSVSPSLLVVTFPYLFRERSEAFAILDGAIGQRLAADAQKAGLKLLGWHDLGLRHVINKKRSVNSIADMRGLKLRVQPNPVHVAAFRAFGANPVAMDFKELYSAIQQGVVDGIEYPLVTTLSQRFYEVTKYVSLTGHVKELMVTFMNKAAFDRLPAELQGVIVEAGKEEVAFQRRILREAEKRALDELKEKGMVVNQLAREQLEMFVERSQHKGASGGAQRDITPTLGRHRLGNPQEPTPQRTLAASSRADRARRAVRHRMPAYRPRQPACGPGRVRTDDAAPRGHDGGRRVPNRSGRGGGGFGWDGTGARP